MKKLHNMKKIHVLIYMIVLLSVTSCVNLDLNPPSAASSENWFSSPEEVRISLNDFYRSTFFVIEEGWTLDRNTDDWAQRTNIYTIAAGSLMRLLQVIPTLRLFGVTLIRTLVVQTGFWRHSTILKVNIPPQNLIRFVPKPVFSGRLLIHV